MGDEELISLCVCVCVCVRARACMPVYITAYACVGDEKLIALLHHVYMYVCTYIHTERDSTLWTRSSHILGL